MPSSFGESTKQSMAALEVHPVTHDGARRRASPTPSPHRVPNVRRRPSRTKQREKLEFFRKYSPLGSSHQLLSGTNHKLSNPRLSEEDTSWPLMLDPTGKRAFYWLAIITSAVVYYAWTIVLRMSFPNVQQWFLWVLLDAFFYVLYALDLLVQMRTSYLRDGILEEDLCKLRVYYTSTWYFKLDLLSVLPLEWGYMLATWSVPPTMLLCFKLMKVYRLRQFADRLESRSHFPNLCRVLFLVHNLLVIIHWNACIYFLLSHWIGLGSDTWVYPQWNDTHNCEWGHLLRQYIYSFYWSTLTLTTIGELPAPQNNVEYIFVTFDYLVGILMFATLLGNVGSIIANMQKSRTKFQNKMDSMKTYMRETRVPNHLQERVIKWFDYLWTHGHPVDDQRALGTLPEKLKAEIGIHVHFETLKKVDFFEECEQGLLWELVLRLRTQIYSPGEYVCRKGDVGREMYIVNSGHLEVSAEEDGEVLRELVHGEYFGEISVLNLGNSHRRRTAFVRSVGYSALLCLSQSDLLDVLKEYPKTMDMLVEKGKKKLGMDNEQQEEEEEEQERCERLMSFDEEEDALLESSSEAGEEFQGPPFALQSVADQVINVHIRLSQVESLLKDVLNEVRSGRKNNTPLPSIPERFQRKISSPHF